MERDALVRYLDDFLRIDEIQDYGPQGLQVESENQAITRIALAVDTAPPIIEEAAAWGADLLLVHHGLFWGQMERIAGPLGARVRLLLRYNINLYAAHLALDAHPEVGNNAELARLLGVSREAWWCAPKDTPIGVLGTVAPGATREQMAARIRQVLGGEPVVLPYGPELLERVAIVSGSAASHAGEAAAAGADTLITGETSHAHYWAASDYGINVIFAGHYATETVGVQALGRHLAERFPVEVKFLDFPTEM